MKIKTPPQIRDLMNKTSQDVLNHIQAMTDDVRGILSGGLNFFDKQLPFEVRTVTVTSGQVNYMTIQSPYSTIGAIPIMTNGANILSMSSQNSNRFSITLTMDVNIAQIVFLIIGTNI